MNKHIYTIVVPLLVMVFGIQADVHAEGYKLGVVNALRAFEKSPQTEVARKKLEKEFEQRNKQLIAEQKKLKANEDRLAKDAAIMSESERNKIEREIITQRRELKRSQDQYREDRNFRSNEEFANIQKDTYEAIQKVAIENNYDVVLSEGVIYASPKVDMTNLVLEYMKKGSAEDQGGE